MAQQPLSPNEIRDRALKFAREWEGVTNERAEAQSFWNDFFEVFGISRRRVATFEEFVKPIRKKWEEGDLFQKPGKPAGSGFIDLLWKGMLIAEHKSLGKDLDSAYIQALDYLPSLAERDLPRYVIVSDFARIRLYDLETRKHDDVLLKDLYKKTGLFGFISGYTTQRIEEQDPVNVKAAEKMGRLHDALKQSGYTGHKLEVLLVRLLFCLFAEDTTIFNQKDEFRLWIENCTREDGSDLGAQLNFLFQILDTKPLERQKDLDERFASFPHVNGKLFAETLPVAAFNSQMRDALLNCCALDWSRISPAIFGALFQSVMDDKARRNLGAHYTSEKNILKVIKSLFLDDLRAEFEHCRKNRNKLFEFHGKLRSLKFFDPACGCGNFLVIAYRELRQLELDLAWAMQELDKGAGMIGLIDVNVDQFYGIEIEEFPAQIAQVAMWLMDHQMNMRASEVLGNRLIRLPLEHAPTIRQGDALKIDWNSVLPSDQVTYIFGNPPFIGAKYMNDAQRSDMESVCGDIPSYGLLDYVSAWYVKAVYYLKGDQRIQDLLDGLGPNRKPKDHVKIAFVSTNSITQGEQVAVLWGWLLGQGVKIHFAHRTFQWSNEARGQAAVHCVIIGFALFDSLRKVLFDYPDIKADPHEAVVSNINPYLVDAADVLVGRRELPICRVPEIGIGNKPIDGGYYLFTDEEKAAFLSEEPRAKPFFHKWLGAEEFLNGFHRWILWVGDCSPQDLRGMPEVLKRVEAVRKFRLNSKSAPTRKLAETPTRFHVENMPSSEYIVIPEVSSERRKYIPLGFLSPKIISSNKLRIMPNASLFYFGVLSSLMHMAWVRYVTGRLKSDYQYSVSVVYNNFPWPSDVSKVRIKAIEGAAQEVLDARGKFSESTLADLYDPTTMPPELSRAHAGLDHAVDAAYGNKKFTTDAERVAFLFDLYQTYATLLPAAEKPKRGKRKTH